MKKDDSKMEITETTIVTMDTEQIIEVTLAKFNEVETADYPSLVAPYRELDYKQLGNPETLKEIEEVRKTLKATRTGIERLRKGLKEDSLRTGRAIDAKAKELTEPILEPENFLEDLVSKYRRHVEDEERRKAEALTKMVTGRMNALALYGHIVAYDDVLAMDELEYQDLLQEKISEFELNQALEKEENERKAQAEAERLERLKQMDAKERELFKKELGLLVKMFGQLPNMPIPLVVPDNIPIDVCNELLSDYDWVYQKDYVEPVIIAPLDYGKRTDMPDDFFDALDQTKERPASNAKVFVFDESKPTNELSDEQAAVLADRSELQIVAQLIRQIQQPTLRSEKAKPFQFNQKMSALLEWMESF